MYFVTHVFSVNLKQKINFCLNFVFRLLLFCVENRERFLLGTDGNMVFTQILSHIS